MKQLMRAALAAGDRFAGSRFGSGAGPGSGDQDADRRAEDRHRDDRGHRAEHPNGDAQRAERRVHRSERAGRRQAVRHTEGRRQDLGEVLRKHRAAAEAAGREVNRYRLGGVDAGHRRESGRHGGRPAHDHGDDHSHRPESAVDLVQRTERLEVQLARRGQRRPSAKSKSAIAWTSRGPWPC